jgi:hypothetical protein
MRADSRAVVIASGRGEIRAVGRFDAHGAVAIVSVAGRAELRSLLRADARGSALTAGRAELRAIGRLDAEGLVITLGRAELRALARGDLRVIIGSPRGYGQKIRLSGAQEVRVGAGGRVTIERTRSNVIVSSGQGFRLGGGQGS